MSEGIGRYRPGGVCPLWSILSESGGGMMTRKAAKA